MYICTLRRQWNTVSRRRSGIQLLTIWSYLLKALVYSSQKWELWFVVICIVRFSVDGWGCVLSLLFTWGNQSRIFIGRTDAEAETPILWLPDAKNWLIWKDPDAGKDWRQEEKGTTEDEMVGWHHRLNRHEFGWTPGVGVGQGGLVCCSPWGRKESDTTERLNWTDDLKCIKPKFQWSLSIRHLKLNVSRNLISYPVTLACFLDIFPFLSLYFCCCHLGSGHCLLLPDSCSHLPSCMPLVSPFGTDPFVQSQGDLFYLSVCVCFLCIRYMFIMYDIKSTVHHLKGKKENKRVLSTLLCVFVFLFCLFWGEGWGGLHCMALGLSVSWPGV